MGACERVIGRWARYPLLPEAQIVIVFDLTPEDSAWIVIARALRCDHVKVPSSLTAAVAVAGTARLPPTVHVIVTRFVSIPAVEPFTRMSLRSAPVPRVPVIMIDRARSPEGVTWVLGADAADQPAPESARTVTV